MPSQTVYHSRYGRGTATVHRKSGLEMQVRFENGQNLWVRTDELELQRPAEPAPQIQNRAGRKSAYFVKRKIVEALRLGIVPDEGLELFTIGRKTEIEELDRWLQRPDDPSRLLIGPYGTGKTHLLNYFRVRALSAGYAVSLVEMDPQETPFSKPKRVYSQIVRNLEWHDGNQTRDFTALLKRILGRGYLPDHAHFSHMRRVADSDSRMWDWICGIEDSARPFSDVGEFAYLPGLYSHTTTANIYCYLLSGLGWGCQRKGIDLKGLLVLFDESEALYAARGQLARERGVNFLDTLNVTASDDKSMLRRADESDFEYSGFAPHIPFLYKAPCGLKLLFAFTSAAETYVSQTLSAIPCLELAPLTEKKFGQVLKRIGGVYNEAYLGRAQQANLDEAIARIEANSFVNTREIVKSYIEALDISRFGTSDEDDSW